MSAKVMQMPPESTGLDYFLQCLEYDQQTGALTWLRRPREHFATAQAWKNFNTRFAGVGAGSPNNEGYVHIKISGRLHKAHRLAWLITHREWPYGQIDHINHNRSDNRLDNLRVVTNQQNTYNQKKRKTNASGFTGVGWHKRICKWQAQIQADGKKVCLGYFENIEAAVAARKAAEENFGFHPNHGQTTQ